MAVGNSYNGFSFKERNAKNKELLRRLASGEQPPASGPCALCGDPEVEVEYHDEDYSVPYQWNEPAIYALCLCRHCHRHKLHMRFARPLIWQAYLAHVRRGGYARDLKDPRIKQEFIAYCKAIEMGQPSVLHEMRPYTREIGEEWFARLRLDRPSLTNPSILRLP